MMEELLTLMTEVVRSRVSSCIAAGLRRILVILVMTMLLMIVLILFTFGFIILLGNAMENWCGAIFIVGGIYFLMLTALFLLRKKLYKRKRP